MKKLEQILAAAGLIGSLFIGSAKAEVYDIPVQTQGIDYNGFFNSLQDGDIVNLVAPENRELYSPLIFQSISTDKSITVNGNSLGFGSSFTATGNSTITFNNTFFSSAFQGANIYVKDNASLNVQNECTFTRAEYGIHFMSSGNLHADSNFFNSTSTGIYIDDLQGRLQITQNLIISQNNALTIRKDAPCEVYILNNTVNTSNIAFSFPTPLSDATGVFANNLITDCGVGIQGFDNLANYVDVTANNFFANNENYSNPINLMINQLSIASRGLENLAEPNFESKNYFLDPQYVGEGESMYKIQNTSPLVGKGKSIPGLTNYFDAAGGNWVGYDVDGEIPEPTTLALLGAGLGISLLRRRKDYTIPTSSEEIAESLRKNYTLDN